MKICPNCHRKNSNKFKFCRYCGTKLPANSADSNSIAQGHSINYKYCPNCHYKNNKDAKFCVKCGYNFGSENTSKAVNISGIRENTRIVTAPHTNYKQQWNQANKSLNAVTDYSNNYFTWYKDTLIHPLATHKASPYFGMTLMAIMAILVC